MGNHKIFSYFCNLCQCLIWNSIYWIGLNFKSDKHWWPQCQKSPMLDFHCLLPILFPNKCVAISFFNWLSVYLPHFPTATNWFAHKWSGTISIYQGRALDKHQHVLQCLIYILLGEKIDANVSPPHISWLKKCGPLYCIGNVTLFCVQTLHWWKQFITQWMGPEYLEQMF